MSDLLPQKSDQGDDPANFQTLASQALDMVMTPSRAAGQNNAGSEPYAAIIEALSEAFLADDPDMRREAVARVLRSGIDGAEFIQSHAGDVARMLGDLWADNKISFAETTIGVARMQETVRALASRRRQGSAATPAPEILLLAPESENHLLGLFIACEAFEDMGCYVHLAIGQSVQDIEALTKKRPFAMIGISISSLRTVKEARAIIQRLRQGQSRHTPIVLGGGLVAHSAKHAEVLAELAVDHIVSDPAAALKHCGIEISAQRQEVTA